MNRYLFFKKKYFAAFLLLTLIASSSLFVIQVRADQPSTASKNDDYLENENSQKILDYCDFLNEEVSQDPYGIFEQEPSGIIRVPIVRFGSPGYYVYQPLLHQSEYRFPVMSYKEVDPKNWTNS